VIGRRILVGNRRPRRCAARHGIRAARVIELPN
jgi:hypothetical protein